jgi:Flp pilus assembly protein TadD
LLLLTLGTLTGKLIMNRKASSASTTITASVPPQDEAKAMTQAGPPANEISKTEEEKPEEETLEEEKPKAEKPKAEKPKAEKPVVKRPSPEKNAAKDPGAQARRAKAAKEAAVKRGPQPKTAADFVDRGRQAIVLGDYVAARIHYLEAVFMEPNNAAANQGLAFAALKQGDESFAVTHFCKALSLSNPTSSMAKEAHKNLATLNEKCP